MYAYVFFFNYWLIILGLTHLCQFMLIYSWFFLLWLFEIIQITIVYKTGNLGEFFSTHKTKK